MPSQPAPNPLLAPWTAPYGLAPFAEIRPSHFEPAFAQALQEHRAAVDAIAHNPQAPDFGNTLAALDCCDRRLAGISMVFHNLCTSETSPELQDVQRRMAPVLAAHWSAIAMHQPLFARVDALHERRARLGLDPEQMRLLERTHLNFVRAGALLGPAAQERYAQIAQELAALQTSFGQNVLHDESTWALVLREEAELAGLPEFVRSAARTAAQQRGLGDVLAITLSRSSIVPFLTFSERRDLREQAWRAWVGRGAHEGKHDNRPLIGRILQLRQEQARLHGYATYADYALVDRMARTPEAVDQLLDNVFERAKAALQHERASLEAAQRAAGSTETVEAWDWRYWAEKVRQRDFALDDAQVKPYFPLPAMVEAAFDCAQRLFGLRFTPRTDLTLYHPDARAYEVHDAQGRAVGLFIQDNFARTSKRSGAWMSSLAVQARNGGEVLPVILNNNNFAEGSPTLLSFDDVRTLFHEFGHGLHGLLSNVTYGDLAGTQVLRDFVELPSQLFEHWMAEPQVLRRHAKHVETGEPIPDALIERLRAAAMFGEAYETVRYCGSAIVDMAVHRHPDSAAVSDWPAFEDQLLRERGLPEAAGINHRLAHFQHLFGGGYAAGYYVYLWAEVLDADAWDAFMEAGSPFDVAVAERLKRCIYSTGNSVEPGAAFRAFRGRDPVIEPLLRQKGLGS
ncbi:M3 family metallopeptidase [Ramlibacter alkalitolerans]|uniref:M3 family metallopeptidase n=1 Tax=Ramlibacter alkalitolerans TaxID=2039631 RepID=A0ABS1JKQ2_9BURK|nr:M3 family metallopeptidase [Ramlibacter alkalitolerans]MBL0424807.1 M3 family metallopeptidase [Ramlibacter alkalitolerans]